MNGILRFSPLQGSLVEAVWNTSVSMPLLSLNNVLFHLKMFSKGYHILQQHVCLHKFKIPPLALEELLGHLELGYTHNANPYHNNLHASDVLQSTHWFVTQTGIKNWLSDLEIFALLFSAIIHDYDHTGTTNNFHIQSTSSLAVLYNDRAVLENHHVAQFFRLAYCTLVFFYLLCQTYPYMWIKQFRTMLDNDCNILGNLTKAEYKEFRTLMIDMVLHTGTVVHKVSLCFYQRISFLFSILKTENNHWLWFNLKLYINIINCLSFNMLNMSFFRHVPPLFPAEEHEGPADHCQEWGQVKDPILLLTVFKSASLKL